jgi:hypothetical protein
MKIAVKLVANQDDSLKSLCSKTNQCLILAKDLTNLGAFFLGISDFTKYINYIKKYDKFLPNAIEKSLSIISYELKSVYYQTCLDLTIAKHQFYNSIEIYENIWNMKNQVFSLESQMYNSEIKIRFKVENKEYVL